MMSLIESYKQFQELERGHPVENVQWQGLHLWPLFRVQLFFRLREKNGAEKEAVENKFKRQLGTSLIAILKGFIQAFARADVLFVSYDSELKEIQGRRQNKHFFYWYELFKSGEHVMLLEKPVSGALKASDKREPFCVNSLFIYAFEFVLRRFVKTPAYQGQDLVSEIYRKAGVANTTDRDLRSYLAFRMIYRFFLKIWQPRIVVLTNHYNLSHFALLTECKAFKIKVIEIQHGVINRQHPGYNYYNDQLRNTLLRPDALITYGERVADCLSANFKSGLQIWPLGHSYLSFIKESSPVVQPTTTESRPTPPMTVETHPKAEQIRPAEPNTLAQPHKMAAVSATRHRRVLVTLQTSNLAQVMPFIESVAQLNPTYHFELLPRRKNDLQAQGHWPANIKIVFDDFYQLISRYDLHVTAFSTCAIEAPVFGVPNVLINFDGMAAFYYADVLTGEALTEYVREPKEFSNSAERILQNQLNVSAAYSQQIASDYRTRLEKYWPQIWS